MKIAIIKYNAGNTASVKNALQSLGVDPLISDDAQEIMAAERVIFPGVGEAASALRYLQAKGLDRLLPALKQPVLGICLGMQLMCRSTEEGPTSGLEIFDAAVKKFPATDIVPHMGWNNLEQPDGPLFKGLENTKDFYFVHSYYAELSRQTAASCNYILPFSAALQKDNFYAVQFHPEKSGKPGLQLLQNFLEL